MNCGLMIDKRSNQLVRDKKMHRNAQSASGEAQPYLPHVILKVIMSAHFKFNADWSKTVGARGIYIQIDRQTILLLLYRLALQVTS